MNPVLEEDLLDICKSEIIDWRRFDHLSFFISGITGFIGSLLVKTLYIASKQYGIQVNVTGLIRDRYKAEKVFSDLSDSDFFSLNLVEGDIRSDFLIDEPIDYVIHGASPTQSSFFINHPIETIETLVSGTDNVLKLARDKRIKKMVYLSSMEVYGQPDKNKEEIKEADLGYIDPLSNRSSYSEGKRMCECLCFSAANEFDLDISIARLAQTFGPGIGLNDNRIFMQFAKSVINEEDIVLHTRGLSEGNYVYSTDAIIGILLLLQKGKNGEAYNIVNEESHTTIKDMAEMVEKNYGRSDTRVVYDLIDINRTGYAPDVRMKLSAGKIKNLGWNAEIGLDVSYKRLIEYLKK